MALQESLQARSLAVGAWSRVPGYCQEGQEYQQQQPQHGAGRALRRVPAARTLRTALRDRVDRAGVPGPGRGLRRDAVRRGRTGLLSGCVRAARPSR